MNDSPPDPVPARPSATAPLIRLLGCCPTNAEAVVDIHGVRWLVRSPFFVPEPLDIADCAAKLREYAEADAEARAANPSLSPPMSEPLRFTAMEEVIDAIHARQLEYDMADRPKRTPSGSEALHRAWWRYRDEVQAVLQRIPTEILEAVEQHLLGRANSTVGRLEQFDWLAKMVRAQRGRRASYARMRAQEAEHPERPPQAFCVFCQESCDFGRIHRRRVRLWEKQHHERRDPPRDVNRMSRDEMAAEIVALRSLLGYRFAAARGAPKEVVFLAKEGWYTDPPSGDYGWKATSKDGSWTAFELQKPDSWLEHEPTLTTPCIRLLHIDDQGDERIGHVATWPEAVRLVRAGQLEGLRLVREEEEDELGAAPAPAAPPEGSAP